jgi:hypothetical protein
MTLILIGKDDAPPPDCLVEFAALTAIVSRVVMIMVCPSLKTLPIHSAEESEPRGVLAVDSTFEFKIGLRLQPGDRLRFETFIADLSFREALIKRPASGRAERVDYET